MTSLMLLWSDKILYTISIFLHLLRHDLWPKMWSVLENVPCALEKKMYSSAFGWKVLKISRSIWFNVSFKICVSLLIFCFDDVSIGVRGVLSRRLLLCCYQFTLLRPLVFPLCIEVLLCWVHKYYKFVINSSWIDPVIIM